MFGENKSVAAAPPSSPVEVIGWRDLPSSGDEVIEAISEVRISKVNHFMCDSYSLL